MWDFTRRQWLTFIVIGVADFCNAICVSLQAPFYPQEAEKKGATATEYGLVFGIFELVVFVVSPFYGQHLNRIGPKILFNGGIYTTGVCAILFGLLDRVEGHTLFVSLSFIIRIVEAMGNAAFLTASFAIIAKEFPDKVSVMFASLETFFGLGLIVGPMVGGFLYGIGGYTTPFAVMGTCLFCAAIMTGFVLPVHEKETDRPRTSLVGALKIPGVLMACSSIIVTSISIGYLQATLEPHLRKFDLSPVALGFMFVINGGMYAGSAPLWGTLCDRFCTPKVVTVIGTILIAVGFSLVGPAPYIPLETSLPLCITGLVMHGLGIGAQLVSSFTDALRTSVANGYENNLDTYGLISGLWTSTFALGAFIGPSVSGYLFDRIGFEYSSLFVVVSHVIVCLMLSIYLCVSRRSSSYVEIKSEAPVEQNGDPDNIARSTTSITENVQSIRSIANGISIERSRPAAMNSLIACNSYKSQAWSRKHANGIVLSQYSQSYGTLDPRGRNAKANGYTNLVT